MDGYYAWNSVSRFGRFLTAVRTIVFFYGVAYRFLYAQPLLGNTFRGINIEFKQAQQLPMEGHSFMESPKMFVRKGGLPKPTLLRKAKRLVLAVKIFLA